MALYGPNNPVPEKKGDKKDKQKDKRPKSGETIFSPISNKVVKQITNREEFTGRNTKTATDLAVLNQNTGWVKVSSGSNIISKDGTKTWSGPAQRFVLHGGSIMTVSQANNKGVSTSRQGINFQKETSFDDSDKAYSNYNDKYGLGFRPMPGITSFNLKTYNPYGTLRQADITFTVWTLDDLEQAERLFLRPGYTCVIEFGHSVFLKNDKSLTTFGKTINTLSENFLFNKQPIDEVEKQIEFKREEADGNYDGFFGYVSNFSYSFRPDGGYDCSIKVVSKGVILDAIKGGETTDNASVTNKSEEETKPIDAAIPKYQSIFHTIFKAVSEYIPDPDNEDSFVATLDTVIEECLTNQQEIKLFATLDTVDQCKFIYAEVKDPPQNEGDKTTGTATERLSYIPIRFVLDMFNKYASIYDIKDTVRKDPIIGFALDFGNKFRTYQDHFSVSPSNVHLPKASPKIQHPDGPVLYGMTANAADAKMEDYAMSGNSSNGNGKNEILNIFVSTKILLSLADEVYDQAGVSDSTMIDFLNAMIKIINTALSDVTKLSLFYNEPRNKYEIVDLNGVGKLKKKLPRLTLTGLKSTVKELSIQSRLSTNTAAQISIAAQGDVDTYKDNVSAIRNWNLGSVDRFVPSKTSNPNKRGGQVSNPINKFKVTKENLPYGGSIAKFLKEEENKGIATVIKNFFDDIRDNESFDADAEKNIQQTLRKINLLIYSVAQVEKSDDDVKHEIPIPIELSFTMRGISGLKIGQVFKIKPGVLLSKYDKYGYVITGVDNKVENNEWTTEVSTQFFETDNL